MKIRTIYVFGDSLHDTGNLLRATNGYIPSSLYHNGRFSNGPVCCEYIRTLLEKESDSEIKLINFAFGGAMTAYKNGYSPKSLTLTRQIEISAFSFASEDLIIIGCGANNFAFFTDLFSFPFVHIDRIKTVSADLDKCIRNLISRGASNILLLNVPDIFSAPIRKKLNFFFRKLVYPFLKERLRKTNSEIEKMTDTLKKEGVNICLFDLNSIFEDVLKQPHKYGFSDSSSFIIPGMGRYSGTLTDEQSAKNYVFWDYVHPSTRAHKLLAEFMTSEIKRNLL